jgi:SET domain-containing protein
VLLVRTEVRSSSIHGRGLFAVERIREGQDVWRFDPRIDQISAVANGHFSWRTEYGYVTPGDDAKFINHSSTPNLRTTPGMTPVVADRDIDAGEELTESYEYDLDWPSYAAEFAP